MFEMLIIQFTPKKGTF